MKKALVILLALTMVMSMMAIAPIGVAAEDEIAVGSVAADYIIRLFPIGFQLPSRCIQSKQGKLIREG